MVLSNRKGQALPFRLYDYKKIRKLASLHQQAGSTCVDSASWLCLYFWEQNAQDQIKEFLEAQTNEHGPVLSVTSLHPRGNERRPIHLPFIYRHELFFEDHATVVIFQKFHFSWSFISLTTSFTWSVLCNLSSEFRRQHRLYEKTQHSSIQLVHPHPRSLWENYKTFLLHLGVHWKRSGNSPVGPTWVVLTDVCAVTLAVHGGNQDVGSTLFSHLVNAVHQTPLQEKKFEDLGRALAKTVQSCYAHHVACIDVGLGNYILDSEGHARFIDGELLQVFPTGVPSHYKALELALFLGTLALETVREYCQTINSSEPEMIQKYQHGLGIFFRCFLQELSFSKEELLLAKKIALDWSSKASMLYFSMLLSLHHDPRVIRRYQQQLQNDLLQLVDDRICAIRCV